MRTTRVARHIPAPRARAYRALLDPHAVCQWIVPDGKTSHIGSFDPREGGTWLSFEEARTKAWADTLPLAHVPVRRAGEHAHRVAQLEDLAAPKVAELLVPGHVGRRLARRGFDGLLPP